LVERAAWFRVRAAVARFVPFGIKIEKVNFGATKGGSIWVDKMGEDKMLSKYGCNNPASICVATYLHN
jgi:hypothetical protein